MAKIVKFKTKADNVGELLDEIKEDVETNKVEKAIVLLKLPTGEIEFAYSPNLIWGEMQELCSHLQVDIIDKMIKANYVTP